MFLRYRSPVLSFFRYNMNLVNSECRKPEKPPTDSS